jgi:peptidyl-prolyl cis-trans isomerase SurA
LSFKSLIYVSLAALLAVAVPGLAQDDASAPPPEKPAAPPATTVPGTAAPAAPGAAAPSAAAPAGTPDAGANPPPGAAVESDSGPSDGVAAIVNDAVITEYDLRQRELLFIATSGGLQPTADTLAKLRSQILKQLVTEQLQIQEARRKNITVSPPEVDKTIDRLTTDNHLTKEQLVDMLKKGGVNIATLRAQIAIQIAWQKAVSDEFQDRVNITPADVDAEYARQMQGINKIHYLVSSIFLSVDNPDVDAKVQKDAQDIRAQLTAGASFVTVARQFSQSPTAASGGDLGWVYEGQLPTDLDAALHKMEPGQVSDPIRSTGGYYILGLRDRALGANAVIPDPASVKPAGPLTYMRVLLPLGPKPPKPLMEGAMKVAMQIHDHMNGCDMLPKIAEQVHGMVYQDLAKMGLKLTDLNPQIQDAVAKSGPGEATMPFVSDAGIEMMVRCDKRVEKPNKVNLPTRQQIEEGLFDEQITMLSRRYMRDIRRNANVEIK